MSAETIASIADKFRVMRETRFGAFVPVLLALVAIWTYFGITEPAFISSRNFYFLFMQSAVVGTLAVGITIVLLLGDIDLSAAAGAGVCAALMAVLIVAGVPGPIACLAAIALGILLGSLQGLLVAYVGIPAFVVTLAGLLGFQGLMLKILGIQGAINMRDPFVRGITTLALPPLAGWALAALCVGLFAMFLLRNQAERKKRGLELDAAVTTWGQIAFFALMVSAAVLTLNTYRGVPLMVVLLIGITALLGWVTTSTPFGRSLFAAGGNAESARRVGINVRYIRVAAFGLVGLMAAVAGIVGASRYASVSFNAFAGGPLLLEAIGAAVIGGTSLFGGRGSVWNAILGALVIGSLGNGLDLSGASAADKLMFSGAILLLAVAIDAVSRAGTSQSR
ncbi:sugar ABC transporter permease [Roseibium aggregatum]|uniref:sugar ABC transporter permease n=1 Tax=Roseibium aggregatum TaxID=187304 RepID=UPI0025AB90D6|nr:ABC transporter permease [Roseibium aggregatum]WJS05631.1 ABC transporter permease [Roseibium aggregatum]